MRRGPHHRRPCYTGLCPAARTGVRTPRGLAHQRARAGNRHLLCRLRLRCDRLCQRRADQLAAARIEGGLGRRHPVARRQPLHRAGGGGDVHFRIRPVLDAPRDAQLDALVADPCAASSHHAAQCDEGLYRQSDRAVPDQHRGDCAARCRSECAVRRDHRRRRDRRLCPRQREGRSADLVRILLHHHPQSQLAPYRTQLRGHALQLW